MVLITASTVSALISAGIISIFTFLLFLAGYVLQQQSVNSLRAAIRQPPPSPPKPTLPPQFRADSEDAQQVTVNDNNETEINDQIAEFVAGRIDGVVIAAEPTPPQDRLAYILGLSRPSDLCSAALFAQTLSLSTTSTERLVLLYPSSWETAITNLHMAALTFMRSLHDTYPIIYHPVEFVKGWEKASVHSHLLGEMQRTPWQFDRMLYLKTPGFVVDADQVEAALKISSVKKMWTPMTGAVGDNPDLLLWEKKRGLLMPRGPMRDLVKGMRTEIIRADDGSAAEDESVSRRAYAVFDTKLERSKEDEVSLRYSEGLRLVCKGRGLLPDDEDRVNLK